MILLIAKLPIPRRLHFIAVPDKQSCSMAELGKESEPKDRGIFSKDGYYSHALGLSIIHVFVGVMEFIVLQVATSISGYYSPFLPLVGAGVSTFYKTIAVSMFPITVHFYFWYIS